MTDTSLIRTMTRDDLAMVLAWRNHPRVREHMFTQHDITMDEHRAWFEHASRDDRRRLMITENDNGPFGYVQFNNVAPASVSDWGFYVRPQAAPGSGRRLGRLALDHAFSILQLHQVRGQALQENEASRAFHLSLGFTQLGVMHKQHPGDSGHRTVICFGLSAEEWTAQRHYQERQP